MEDYKKKYEDALNAARKFKNDCPSLWDTESNPFRGVFEELKENEDEILRKWLIKYFDKVDDVVEVDRKKIIAWLESKCEQKPTDKIEPKFKVGDWITDGTSTFQIIEIRDEWYIADDGDRVRFDIIDQYYHLWTIQDAKNGDVLVWNDCGDEYIFVFDKLIKDYIHAFIGFNVYLGTIETKEDVTRYYQLNKLYPATKEQRDLLFQKMHEAGYEWNAEKKGLRKINLNKAEHGKYYYCIKDYFSGGKKFASKGDVVQALRGLPIMGLENISEYFLPANNVHKPVWSEEDEKTLNTIIEKGDLKPSEIDWLKSLKE